MFQLTKDLRVAEQKIGTMHQVIEARLSEEVRKTEQVNEELESSRTAG